MSDGSCFTYVTHYSDDRVTYAEVGCSSVGIGTPHTQAARCDPSSRCARGSSGGRIETIRRPGGPTAQPCVRSDAGWVGVGFGSLVEEERRTDSPELAGPFPRAPGRGPTRPLAPGRSGRSRRSGGGRRASRPASRSSEAQSWRAWRHAVPSPCLEQRRRPRPGRTRRRSSTGVVESGCADAARSLNPMSPPSAKPANAPQAPGSVPFTGRSGSSGVCRNTRKALIRLRTSARLTAGVPRRQTSRRERRWRRAR